MAQSLGLGVTAWSPLAAGVLSGKYNTGAKKTEMEGRLDKIPWNRRSERNLKIAQLVVDIAQEVGRSPAQVALNWLRQRSGSVIPIVGARKLDQLRDNLACIAWQLEPEAIERLNAISAVDLGFPVTFMAQGTDFVYGGAFDTIEGARTRVPIELDSAKAA